MLDVLVRLLQLVNGEVVLIISLAALTSLGVDFVYYRFFQRPWFSQCIQQILLMCVCVLLSLLAVGGTTCWQTPVDAYVDREKITDAFLLYIFATIVAALYNLTWSATNIHNDRFPRPPVLHVAVSRVAGLSKTNGRS